jgi:hypothetical protein
MAMEMRTAETLNERGESLADQVLSFVAMAGAVGGAIAGAILGAEVGSAFPVLCGALGTMLGSGLAAGAWCLITDLWSGAFVSYEDGHARDLAAAQLVTQSASAE